MSKSIEKVYDLVEADFREIQSLISQKYGKEFTVGYIRKVCKGKRHNTTIMTMAKNYLRVRKEMKLKIDRLSR